MWALHGGRLMGYSAAGALVAASVSALAELGAVAPVLRPLWTMLHAGALALGVWLLWRGQAPSWLAGAARPARWLTQTQPVRFLARTPRGTRALVVGSCWAVMPCGLLQSALVVAALASGPWQGAGVMAAFAAASGVSLWLAPWLWRRLRGRSVPGEPSRAPVRLAGALLALASGFALWHGVSEQFTQALCASPG